MVIIMKAIKYYLANYEMIQEARIKHVQEIKQYASQQKDPNYIKLVEKALDLGISNFNYFTYDPKELMKLIKCENNKKQIEFDLLKRSYNTY